MVRGILVVLGAYVAMAALVMLGTVAATAALVPGGLAAMKAARDGANRDSVPNVAGAYLVANLLISFAAAVLGGWLVQGHAPAPAFTWACGLAALLLVLGLGMAVKGARGGQPAWYPYLLPLVGVAGVLAGAMLRARG